VTSMKYTSLEICTSTVNGSLKLAKQVLFIFSKRICIYNSSTINESIMMGVASVQSMSLDTYLKWLRQGSINCSFHYRKYFNSCSVVTRLSILILKVGVAPVYQSFKKEVWGMVIEE